jgi:adenosylcobinamide-phosphate synthase
VNLAWPFLLGYAADLLLGDPPGWPHPVRLIGRIIEAAERRLFAPRVAAGLIFWLAVAGGVLAPVVLLLAVLPYLPGAVQLAVPAYLCYTGLATRSLHLESRRVEEALAAADLPGARRALSRIVGRETAELSPAEVRRAVLETVAENLSDGVVAPLFYLLLLGIPGLALYKTANTLDSMVGYKNERYREFGRAAARIDDVLNFLPARLTAWLIVAAAWGLGLDAAGARRILHRDGHKASSPNAGRPEAALAGALGVRLGGPAVYFGTRVEKPAIGDPPGRPLDPGHYRDAVRLLYAVSLAMAGVTALGLGLAGAGSFGWAGVSFQ